MISDYYEWIVMMNNQKNDEGRKRYGGTTLRGYHSMIKKYVRQSLENTPGLESRDLLALMQQRR